MIRDVLQKLSLLSITMMLLRLLILLFIKLVSCFSDYIWLDNEITGRPHGKANSDNDNSYNIGDLEEKLLSESKYQSVRFIMQSRR